ncbi:MAG: hypothetical protein WA584_16305 [Pyrinomonadaceae bacterium]
MFMLKRLAYKMRIFIVINLCLIFALSIISANAQGLNGKYSYIKKNSSGEITIREIKKSKSGKKQLSFKIGVGQDGGSNMFGFCIGELSGIAKEVSSNIYEYNSDFNEKDSDTGEATSCRLTLNFSGKNVIVRELNCDKKHGAACNFEGKFTHPTSIRKKAKR